MKNFQFIEEEIKYINADIDDQNQNIHRHFNTLNDNHYLWALLPRGNYHIDTEYLSESMACVIDLKSFDVHAHTTETGVEFTVNKPTRIWLYLEDVSANVVSLRKQAIVNRRKLQQQSLIKKDIKAHTDLGEEYNIESFYDAIEDCLETDETINIDLTKSIEDINVRILHMGKNIQDIKRVKAKRKQLDIEEAELIARKNELMKF